MRADYDKYLVYFSGGKDSTAAFLALLEAKHRHVDRWRNVLYMSEYGVWKLIEKYQVRAHPCYYLGYSRCSCMFCIFGNQDQFATGRYLAPDRFRQIRDKELEYYHTIKRSGTPINEYAGAGEIYDSAITDEQAKFAAISTEYTMPIFTNYWELPAGAYGTSAGPV